MCNLTRGNGVHRVESRWPWASTRSPYRGGHHIRKNVLKDDIGTAVGGIQ